MIFAYEPRIFQEGFLGPAKSQDLLRELRLTLKTNLRGRSITTVAAVERR